MSRPPRDRRQRSRPPPWATCQATSRSPAPAISTVTARSIFSGAIPRATWRSGSSPAPQSARRRARFGFGLERCRGRRFRWQWQERHSVDRRQRQLRDLVHERRDGYLNGEFSETLGRVGTSSRPTLNETSARENLKQLQPGFPRWLPNWREYSSFSRLPARQKRGLAGYRHFGQHERWSRG